MRLSGYDYTQPGAFFVTLVTQNRLRLFGEIVDGEMRFNEWGEIVSQAAMVGASYPYVDIDEWVIMPNHLHGIIGL
jgi:REP element-mobilizing transposase RayT